jgi:hypothetical protein
MDEGKLKGILDSEIFNALGYVQTETNEARRQAIKYYNRDLYGNEVEGRSRVVTGEVAEVIDGALPQLLRIFTQSDEIALFEPKMPGDEEAAKQATEYCNLVFFQDNQGVLLMHDWFKDALLQKNGIVKYWWDDAEDPTKEEYNDLSPEELQMLFSDGQMELVSQETNDLGFDDMGLPIVSYNVVVKKKKDSGRVRIENVPPEEFLISKKAKHIQDSPFVAHRTLMTRSELLQMGFNKKKINQIPLYSDITYSPERVARYSRGEQPDETQSLDPSMQQVEVYEIYIRCDEDGDGIAELRKITYAGKQILENEETDQIPFASVCPIPMPHKFFGQSLADRAMDIQMIKSTITRQILDNLYLSNLPRMTAIDGQVNMDDLLTVAPNSVIRMKTPGAVQPLTVPAIATQSFPMLDYLDRVMEKRSGVTNASAGLDPSILQNTTAAAIAMMQNAGASRVEMIARIFADTGVKDLFNGIFHLLCKYQDKARIVRMRGKYVSIDPREWKNGYDLSINVGLGTGNKDQQMAMIGMVLQKQEQILQTQGYANPLTSAGQYRNTLGRFIEAAGFKDSSEFFKQIPPELDQMLSNPPPQQAPVDPTVQAYMAQTQAQIQGEQAKLAAQIEANRVKAAADIQLEREKAAAQIQLQREKAAGEIQLERDKAAGDLQLKQAVHNSDVKLKAVETANTIMQKGMIE